MRTRTIAAVGWVFVMSLGLGCAGRSQRVGDGESGGDGGVGGSAATSSGGTGGSAANGSGGVAGKASAGASGSSVGGTGNTSGGTSGGSSGGVGASGGSAGLGGEGAMPPIGEPKWLPQGSLMLSKHLYRRTLSALLGLPFTDDYARERAILDAGLDPQVDAPASEALAEIARVEVSNMGGAALTEAIGCADGSIDCGTVIATTFAPRAFRRPLTQAEEQEIIDIYSMPAELVDPSPLEATVLHVLLSPHTQWIRAMGTPNELGEITLDDFEIASLLSYGITALPPDDQLMAAAAAGALRSRDSRRAQAERLMRQADGRATYQAFIRDWFRIRDAADLWLYEAEPDLAESMLLETNRFIEAATYEYGAPASELLSAAWTMLDSNMVEHYEIEPDSAAAAVDISGTRRRGILGQASFLASRSYAEQGGLIARSVATLSLLCEDPPEPPLEVPPVPEPEPSSTYREALSQATAHSSCQSCHAVLDPVAFSFGKFDGRGVFSELEGSIPIDSTGTVNTFDGVTFSFEDSADLAEQMALHPNFAECFDRNVVAASAGANLRDESVTDYVMRAASDDSVPSMLETVLRWAESEHFVRRVACCAFDE